MADSLSYQTAYQIINDAIFGKSSHLDLSNLGLSDIPPIISQAASHLLSINLSQNKLRKFPIDELIYLQNLEMIRIEDNYITELPADIRHLKKLKFLILQNNSLSSLPTEFTFLENLLEINVDSNKFSQFPIELTGIKYLESLSINSNNLENIPSEIGNIAGLKTLSMSTNQIRVLPSQIGLLVNLHSLDISHNKIADLPDEIGDLESLTNLNLAGNELSSLPKTIRNLSKLRRLYLSDNFLLLQPETINKPEDPAAIFDDYFSNLKVPFNECKVLVVGEGSVGKTSLIRRLINNDFNPNEPKTDGISINKLVIPSNFPQGNRRPKITLNFWDFGGQGIMQATHQFFFTKRSIYLLVVDSRSTQEQNRVEYWLKLIQLYGDMSPVLIVGSKTDQHQLDIERTNLKKKYPNIVDVYETSATDGRGTKELLEAIVENIQNLPHVQIPVSQNWLDIKDNLEYMRQSFDYITYDKYEDMCRKNKINAESEQTTLITFLHDLGVILHFKNDPRLQALGILNPLWATNGVYKILNSPTLFQNKGLLTLPLLDEALNSPEYPQDKRLFIVDLMERFELSYPVEINKIFLVPDLLPKDEPTGANFNGIPSLVYKYPVLPPNILTRFIVRVNQKIHDGLVWRTGVVLKLGKSKVLIKSNIEENKITIEIDEVGQLRRATLSAIMYQLDEIHDMPPKAKPQKRVPVPGKSNIEPIDYEFLLNLEDEGVTRYPVPDGDSIHYIMVQELLSGIEKNDKKADRLNTDGGNVIINIAENAKVGDIVIGKNNIQESFNKAESAGINNELKEALRQLADAISTMNKSLTKEESVKVENSYQTIIDEAIKPNPNKEWYSVSIDGLISAAQKLDKLGEPVINLSHKVLSLLTGGVIN